MESSAKVPLIEGWVTGDVAGAEDAVTRQRVGQGTDRGGGRRSGK